MRTTRTILFGFVLCLFVAANLHATESSSAEYNLEAFMPDSAECAIDTAFLKYRNSDALSYRVWPAFDSLEYRYIAGDTLPSAIADSLWITGTTNDTNLVVIMGLEAESSYLSQFRVWCADSSEYTDWTELFADSTRCVAPADSTARLVGTTSKGAQMESTVTAEAYEWVIRKIDHNTARHVETTGPSIHWHTLYDSTCYEWKMRVRCGEDWSDYTSPKSFCTDAHTPVCHYPASHDYHAGSMTHNSVHLSCEAPGTRYMWSIVRDGSSTWSTQETTTHGHTWTNLHPGSRYGYKIKVLCSNGIWSEWSEVKYFTTTVYCANPGHSHMRVTKISYTSARSYCDMDGYEYIWAIRKKGQYGWDHQSSTTSHFDWSNLHTGTKYEWKVKVKCHGGLWTSWSPLGWFETHEHYPTCASPGHTHVNTSHLGYDKAQLNCSVEGYEYHWAMRPWGSYGDWTHKVTTTNHYGWNNLWSNKKYEWKVKVKCHNGVWTDWAPVQWFKTHHYGSSNCKTPNHSHMTVSHLSHNYARMNCAVTGASAYKWGYRKYGTSQWVWKESTHNYYNVSGLWENSKYEWKVMAKCHGGWTQWSPSGWFTTHHNGYGSSCSTPAHSHMNVTGITHSYGKTHCSVSGKEYHWYIRKWGSSHWGHHKTSSASYGWDNLWSNTKYEWKVKVLCDNGHWTNFSPLGHFTTHSSGYGGGGSCHAPAHSHMSVSDLSYNQARMNCAIPGGSKYKWAYRQWGSTYWSQRETTGSNYKVTGLWSNKKYEWKVMVKCNGHWTNWSPQGHFTTHHYGSGSSCSAPNHSHMTVSHLSHNYARMNCAVTGASSYKWGYRRYGSSQWVWKESSHNYHNMSSLWANTKYEWKVMAKCSSGWTQWSPVGWFTTHQSGYGGTNCTTPNHSHMTVSQTSHNYAQTNCSVNGTEYHWKISQVGYINWTDYSNSQGKYGWSNLKPNTKYEWQVKVKCNDGHWSSWSPKGWFTTHGSGYGGGGDACYSPSSNQYTAVQETYNLFRMHCYMSAPKYEWAVQRHGYSWVHHTTTASNMGWGNLAANTRYNYKVRVTCNDGNQSNWSSAKYFWTSASGSSARSAPVAGDPVPIDDAVAVERESEMTLYPNPASHSVSVEGVMDGERITLLNTQGQPVFDRIMGGDRQRLDLQDLPAGVYQVILHGEQGILARKKLVLVQ